MPDVLGYRGKWGVLVPSTNTVVEPDFYAMAPPGITLHTSRISITNPRIDDDAAFEALMVQIRSSIAQAVADVLTAEPDCLVMGMSSETFWGGRQGNEEFQRRIAGLAGMPIATGANACARAFGELGSRRLGVVTPYQAIGDAQVRRFFEESGYEVVALTGLRCPTAVSMAHADEATLRRALGEVNRPDVDTIVQVGTNLSMLRLADAADRELGKPVIAINGATFWYALRSNGIADRMAGFGRLLRDH
ncbi:MAG TPA: arylmalonate decarboxylase [Candidatus Binatia bacterium]|nr:arylmalonate decarboxylase [Candidatus Binatia bacterium]